ncbi:MAG: M42 family peptidase [Erysipelotrichia bacterium]|nr:M42 family peptidase [Erysipelotrichia bacterium]
MARETEIKRIIALSDAFGPSGMEDDVSALVKEELNRIGIVSEEDCMRNVRAVLNPDAGGKKLRVMLDAHLDEVGVITQAVKPNGTMTFLPLGGWAPVNFPSSVFNLRNRNQESVKAVIASKPPHFMSDDEKNKAPSVSDMVLDCGSKSHKDTLEQYHLGIGCFGVPNVKADYLESQHLFFGKAFDCRIGVAAEIETLSRLKGEELPCTVLASFPAQEEMGERGAMANTHALKPDVAICFEGCPADDTFQEPWLIQAALYQGPMLRDFDVSMITCPRFERFALKLAEEKKIPVQESVRQGGGTDGGKIHLEGIPTIVIGIPVRYIHSSSCWCTLDDYEHAVQLAVELLKTLDADIAASF